MNVASVLSLPGCEAMARGARPAGGDAVGFECLFAAPDMAEETGTEGMLPSADSVTEPVQPALPMPHDHAAPADPPDAVASVADPVAQRAEAEEPLPDSAGQGVAMADAEDPALPLADAVTSGTEAPTGSAAEAVLPQAEVAEVAPPPATGRHALFQPEDPPAATLTILRPAAEALATSAARLPEGVDLVMELTLQTEADGPIRFTMEAAGDVIRVHLAAQQAEVMDLLRRHAADLVAGLQESGYREAQMSFGDWPHQRPSSPPPVLPDAAGIERSAVQMRVPPPGMRAGLDIRW